MNKSIIAALIIALTLIHSMSFSETKLDYKGEASFENWIFANDATSANQTNTNNTIQLKAEATLTSDFFSIRLEPRIKEDFSERSRGRLLLDEGWFGFTFSSFEFRAGFQQFTWGMVESQKLVDILNQNDYEDDFFDPDKLGTLSARIIIAPVDKLDIELYYLAYFIKAKFPTTKGRYSLTNGLNDIQDKAVFGNKAEEWYPNAAARIFMTVSTFDIALSFFHGYNRFPSLDILGNSYYYIMNQPGLEVTWVPGKPIFKLEAVYRNTRGVNNSSIPSALIPDPYFAYVAGVEYTVTKFIGNADLTLFLEYLGDSDVGTTTTDFRLLQNDLFLAIQFALNDVNSKVLQIGATFDLDHPEEFLFLVKFDQRFEEDFTFSFRLDGVNARSGSRLNIFKEELRLRSNITYHFGS